YSLRHRQGGFCQLLHMRNETAGVGRTLGDGVINDELVFSCHLYVVTRFQLTVLHMILFHSHEGGIVIGFRKTIALAENFMMLFVLFHTGDKVLTNLLR